jgi:hypothetical protein
MPNDALTYRIGETKRIGHRVDSDTEFIVSAAVISIYDAAGVAVESGATAAVDNPDEALFHEVYYLWTPDTAGDYTYQLVYTVGAQDIALTGLITVLPAVSKYDAYIHRIGRALAESEIGDAQAELACRDLMDAVSVAVRAYSDARPRRRQVSIALTASQWEYPLSGITGWETEFSSIVSLEPDVDATIQTQYFLAEADWYVDEERATPVWGFRNRVPSAGETARITYTAPHSLTHTTTTLPTRDFEAICLYAAGVAAETALASLAARTEAPEQGAELVSRRDQTARWQSQAKALKAAGRKLWARQEFYL